MSDVQFDENLDLDIRTQSSFKTPQAAMARVLVKSGLVSIKLRN